MSHPKVKERGRWTVALAERDDAGQWCIVGEPVADADFPDQVLAYEYAEKRNKAYLRGFCWTLDPSMAWVAVRFSELGKLRAHKPEAAPAVLAPMARETERHLEAEHDDNADDDEHAGQTVMAWVMSGWPT